MKRSLTIVFSILLMLGLSAPAWSQAPSTEGTEFWVTFMQTEKEDNTNSLKLIFSAQQKTHIRVETPNRNWADTFTVQQGQTEQRDFYASRRVAINNPGDQLKKDCYLVDADNEKATNKTLHVITDKPISLFAANRRDKSLDAANVLPVSALRDEYYIQTYPASNHGGASSCQGTHFCIIATENNTEVDYTLTAETKNGKKPGTTQNVTLNKGQVYYVWTGTGKEGDQTDFSGTHIVARNGKPIAVFQGAAMTNIPYQVHDRDHIYSQAMPVEFWGNNFAITSSLTTIPDKTGIYERIDKIRIMATEDGTDVLIDGQRVYTFDFTQNPKRTYEFDFGKIDSMSSYVSGPDMQYYPGTAHFITTSCPSSVHQFFTSNRYDHEKIKGVNEDYCNGDPAMLWVSPVEQVIKKITFATYNTVTDHFVNIVTTDTASMTINNGTTVTKISDQFQRLDGNNKYFYARIKIPAGNYTLYGRNGFVANAYGFGDKESYAYSCGSSTVSQSIVVNGEHVEIDSISPTVVCVNDSVELSLNIGNNTYDHVLWNYGDGVSETIYGSSATFHSYSSPGWMDLIATASYTNECTGQSYSEDVNVHFYVQKPKEIRRQAHACVGDVIDGEVLTEPGDSIYSVAYDCDSIVTYYMHIGMPKDTFETFHFKNEGWAYGQYFDADTTFTRELKTWDQCDSLVDVTIHVSHCFKMQLTGATYDCDVDRIAIAYTLDRKGGHITQVEDLVMDIDGRKQEVTLSPDGYIYFDDIDSLAPNYYLAKLSLYDTICKDSLYYSIPVQVNYSNTIFDQVYSNVLAVRTAAFNGGYYFTGYQWYQNGMPIWEANESVFHTMEPIAQGEYYVVLTRNDGTVINSCPKSVFLGIVPEAGAPARQAEKKLEGSRLLIVTEDGTFDSYGNRVE